MGKDQKTSIPLIVDQESGTVTEAAMGYRLMTLAAQGWAGIKAELDSTFMTGGSVILQRMGYSYGRYLGRFAKAKALKDNKKLTPSSTWDILLEASRLGGWGKLSINTGDFTMGVVRLILKDCIFCLHDKRGTVANCHFLVGVVGGAADEVTGYNHRVIEGRCRATGDTLCEIILERVSQQEEGAGEPVV